MAESMVERVARALHGVPKKRLLERIRAGEISASMSGIEYFGDWNQEKPERREEFMEMARAAIEEMRNIPIEIQMAGCEAQSTCSIEFDGPLKKHEDCKSPDDWMQRGYGLAKRMMSGQEFMAGWNGAINAALNEQVAG